ncbi:unnamed protein product [Triticum turgidum subsp. durum]|uniref:Uncharacterized protein n=1 Tax=Triticum turgidum subsp. durum TaxID=4567 RepID=A0A9R1QYI6_TRITD|nr:unnamed protein product [Triticum turgidum subsp. durum]
MERFCFLVILSLSGLAVALQLTTPCNAAQAQPPPVYDIDGHELTGNNMYTIMAADRNLSDHCVSAGSFRREECNKHATLTPCKQLGGTRGVHVSIKPAEASDGSGKEASIRLSTDVVIEFKGVVTWCKHHLQWYVHGEMTNQTHVTASCFRGMKGCQPSAGTCKEQSFLFRIERHENVYKLTSCFHAPCRHLVLFEYAGQRWLTVEKDGREPLVVVFKKFPFPN